MGNYSNNQYITTRFKGVKNNKICKINILNFTYNKLFTE